MDALLHRAVQLCVLALVLSSGPANALQETVAAVSQPAANAFKINLDVLRNGERLADPEVLVRPGLPARLTIGNADADQDGALRIEFTVQSGALAAGAKTVRFEATVLEWIGRAWVMVSQPSLLMRDGTVARLSSAKDLSRLELSVGVESILDPRAETSGGSACGELHEPPGAAKNSGDPQCPQLPCDGQTPCCSITCVDPAHYATCCGEGIIICCEWICGGCCSPG